MTASKKAIELIGQSFSATARFQRISPRRVRMVGDLIKGKNVLVALDILTGTKKSGATLLRSVVSSARANAIEMDKQKNLRINPDRFIIADLQVDGGPIMRRSRPMSMGKSGRIRKRSTHVTIVLSEAAVSKNGNERRP